MKKLFLLFFIVAIATNCKAERLMYGLAIKCPNGYTPIYSGTYTSSIEINAGCSILVIDVEDEFTMCENCHLEIGANSIDPRFASGFIRGLFTFGQKVILDNGVILDYPPYKENTLMDFKYFDFRSDVTISKIYLPLDVNGDWNCNRVEVRFKKGLKVVKTQNLPINKMDFTENIPNVVCKGQCFFQPEFHKEKIFICDDVKGNVDVKNANEGLLICPKESGMIEISYCDECGNKKVVSKYVGVINCDMTCKECCDKILSSSNYVNDVINTNSGNVNMEELINQLPKCLYTQITIFFEDGTSIKCAAGNCKTNGKKVKSYSIQNKYPGWYDIPSDCFNGCGYSLIVNEYKELPACYNCCKQIAEIKYEKLFGSIYKIIPYPLPSSCGSSATYYITTNRGSFSTGDGIFSLGQDEIVSEICFDIKPCQCNLNNNCFKMR